MGQEGIQLLQAQAFDPSWSCPNALERPLGTTGIQTDATHQAA
jgi:hypothetical protein